MRQPYHRHCLTFALLSRRNRWCGTVPFQILKFPKGRKWGRLSVDNVPARRSPQTVVMMGVEPIRVSVGQRSDLLKIMTMSNLNVPQDVEKTTRKKNTKKLLVSFSGPNHLTRELARRGIITSIKQLFNRNIRSIYYTLAIYDAESFSQCFQIQA